MRCIMSQSTMSSAPKLHANTTRGKNRSNA